MSLKFFFGPVVLFGFAPFVGAATLVNDNFNNSNYATPGPGNTGTGATTFVNGTKTSTETTVARWTPGTSAAAWQRAELHSNDEINHTSQLLTNASVTYSWTLTAVNMAYNAGITTGAQYRIQLGILPSTAAQGTGNEMFVNTQGGIWLDMNFTGSATGSVPVNLYDANLTKAINSDGADVIETTNVATWAWGTTARTFSLTVTSTGYMWSDNIGTNYGGRTFAAAGFSPALINDSFWGFSMGQDRDTIGKGGHDLTNYSVISTVPEPTSLLLAGFTACAALTRRRRA